MKSGFLLGLARTTGWGLFGLAAVLSVSPAVATPDASSSFQHTLRLEEVRHQVQAGKLRVVDARARMLYERGWGALGVDS